MARRRKNRHKIKCWYCEKPIGGKVWNWGGHPVHKGCHDKCCKKLITGPNLIGKFRGSQSFQGESFFDKNKYFCAGLDLEEFRSLI